MTAAPEPIKPQSAGRRDAHERLDVDLLPEQIDTATAIRDEDYLDARPPHHE